MWYKSLSNTMLKVCFHQDLMQPTSHSFQQESMRNWCPIAPCNVLYKVVTKVITNWLKLVLDKCMWDNQSTFVSERSILDNVMTTIEIVHYMKTKTKGKNYVSLSSYILAKHMITLIEINLEISWSRWAFWSNELNGSYYVWKPLISHYLSTVVQYDMLS